MNVRDIKDSLQQWWYLKDSKTRTTYTKYTAWAVIVAALLWMYYGSRSDQPELTPTTPAGQTTVDMPPKEALEADIREHVDQKLDAAQAETKQMIAEAIANRTNDFPGTPETPPATPAPDTSDHTEEAELGQSNGDVPPPPSYPPAPASMPTEGGQAPGEQGPRFSYVGGISSETLPVNDVGGVEGAPEKKPTSRIQLPVGFMRARLLVGVNALVGEFAQENPQTLMFRVQAPAQLPNSIKMNLRGCFSIANVHGNLSAERIFVLPVSMHCMTMDGRTIVEGPIKGFVSDKDGKRDMAAHVVSRAGTLLASATFAKTVEGFANVTAQSGYETNTSALGAVQTLKSDEMGKTAVTKGLSGGVSELGTYLLDLAKQTSPVLETGPGKDVTLFIQETAELEIKEVRIK